MSSQNLVFFFNSLTVEKTVEITVEKTVESEIRKKKLWSLSVNPSEPDLKRDRQLLPLRLIEEFQKNGRIFYFFLKIEEFQKKKNDKEEG